MTALTRFPLYAALLLLTQCGGCRKQDPAPTPPANPVDLLPPATQTGMRTFGCLVNGQAWTPAGNPFGGALFSTQYYNWNLNIVASRSTTVSGVGVSQAIRISIDSIRSPGRIMLGDTSRDFAEVVDLLNNCTYYTNSLHPGVIDITRLDLVNRIVAGRFSFTLETPGCGKVVVTEGRFDSRF